MTVRRLAGAATIALVALAAGCASSAPAAQADPPVDHLSDVRTLQIGQDNGGTITVGCYDHDRVFWQEGAGGTALAVEPNRC